MKIYQFKHQKFIDSLTPEQCAYLGGVLAEDKAADCLWLNAKELERLCFERVMNLPEAEVRALSDKIRETFADFVKDTTQ